MLREQDLTRAILNHREWYRGKYGPPLHARSLALPNYCPPSWFEADVWEIQSNGLSIEYECKLTRADFRVDKLKERAGERKHIRLSLGDTSGPSRFYYVVPEGLRVRDLLPEFAGLIELGRDWRLWRIVKAPRLHRQPVTATLRENFLLASYRRIHQLRKP